MADDDGLSGNGRRLPGARARRLTGRAAAGQFRRGASLGGVGILSLWRLDRTGFRADRAQLLFDLCRFAAALAVVARPLVAISAPGARVTNLVFAVNRRRDRHVAT